MRTLYLLYFSFFSILFLSLKPSVTTKEELGKKLFFDKRLSVNSQISCASCHKPEFAFADTTALSKGVFGRLGKRNTPSAMNMSSRAILFYDGRASTLEEQAVFPIQDHNEMGIKVEDVIVKIQKDKVYLQHFKELYKSAPIKENVLNAISEFERSLESTSPFDEWIRGDESSVSESVKRGHKLFTDPKNKCFDCHFSPDFTGDEFKNIGLFDGKRYNDSGRYLITKNKDDIGRFKVPGLRNVSVTAPYMHDGSFKTLREVIKYYNDIYLVVQHPINEDSLVKDKRHLSEQDVSDIENFLISLTDPKFKHLIHAKNTHHRRRR